MIYKKVPEPHETQEKLQKKVCLLCSVLVKIAQPKNVVKFFLLVFEN